MDAERDNSDSELDGEVTEQQFLRAATSFEAITLSQIETKNQLGERLNYSIQAGMVILSIIAISILILLWTLSSQINRISSVVQKMNHDFTSVTTQMERMDIYFNSIEKRVALLENIGSQTNKMSQEMALIAKDIQAVGGSVGGVRGYVGIVRGNIENVSGAISHMNHDVQLMSVDMHRMGKPARSMNKMFPFP